MKSSGYLGTGVKGPGVEGAPEPPSIGSTASPQTEPGQTTKEDAPLLENDTANSLGRALASMNKRPVVTHKTHDTLVGLLLNTAAKALELYIRP